MNLENSTTRDAFTLTTKNWRRHSHFLTCKQNVGRRSAQKTSLWGESEEGTWIIKQSSSLSKYQLLKLIVWTVKPLQKLLTALEYHNVTTAQQKPLIACKQSHWSEVYLRHSLQFLSVCRSKHRCNICTSESCWMIALCLWSTGDSKAT